MISLHAGADSGQPGTDTPPFCPGQPLVATGIRKRLLSWADLILLFQNDAVPVKGRTHPEGPTPGTFFLIEEEIPG